MIKYNLKCENDHEFESWFSDSQEYDKLDKKKLLECIYCSSNRIKKSIMSPMISGKKLNSDSFNIFDQKLLDDRDKLIKLRKYVEKNFEFVGNKFSKKVREVYYDKKNNKSIYGTTTSKEREELAEEGIDLLSIPWVSKDN
tara:strand:+ start:1362 stop:1784 length:423 start_codon:yes stop_codon:yes gene_type:complete